MADPNLTTFQGRMCTKVKRQVTNTTQTNISTSTTSTSSLTLSSTLTSTSKTAATTSQAPAQNTQQQSASSSTSATSTAAKLPFRPPSDNTTIPPPQPAPSGSASTSTTEPTTSTSQQALQNPQPAQQTTTNTTQANGVIIALPGAPTTTQQAGTTPQAGAQINTPGSGQQRPPNNSVGAPSPAAGGTATAEPITQPQPEQPIIAQPDTAGTQLQPVPALSATTRAGTHAPTTLNPITSTTVLTSTASNGQLVSITSPIIITPTPNTAGDGHDPSGPDHTGSDASHVDAATGMKAGAVVGTVFGVVSFLLIAGFLFFCFRKRRSSKRDSGTPLITNNSGPSIASTFLTRFGTFAATRPSRFTNAKAAMSEKVHAVFSSRPAEEESSPGPKNMLSSKIGAMFARRRGSSEDIRRMPTPNLERGLRGGDASSSVYSNGPRNRASTMPVMTMRERAMAMFKMPSSGKGRSMFGHSRKQSDVSFVGDKAHVPNAPPRLPSPVAQHRRSQSSVADFMQTWNATDENNDPFRDPDQNQPLSVTNPGVSRQSTATTVMTLTPILQAKAYQQSPPLPTNNSFGIGVALASPSLGTTKQSPLSARHQRSFSQALTAQNPFADPAPTLVKPASPTSIYTTAESSMYAGRKSRGSRPLQHQPSKSESFDSGFVSGKSPDLNRKSNRTSASSENPFGDDLRMSDFQFFDSPDLKSRRTTSQYPSYIDRTSRLSDPFDLDRPEILAGMPPTWSQTMAGRGVSESRRDSSRSRGAPSTPGSTTKTKQMLSGYFLGNDVYRPER